MDKPILEDQFLEKIINEMELKKETKKILLESLPNMSEEKRMELLTDLKELIDIKQEEKTALEKMEKFEKTGEL